ncbi:hypothetical protein AHAS_Ahas13G0359900 [Arachis hypogaea]
MRRFSFDIICKFSFGMDPECFIPSFLESKLADSFDLASKLSVQRAMSLLPLIWKPRLRKPNRSINRGGRRNCEQRRRGLPTARRKASNGDNRGSDIGEHREGELGDDKDAMGDGKQNQGVLETET